MECPNCRNTVPDRHSLCPGCGSVRPPDEAPCPECGRPAGRTRYCAYCGQPLVAVEGARAPVRVERHGRFTRTQGCRGLEL